MIYVWEMKIRKSLRFYLDKVLHEYLQEDKIRKKNIVSFFISKNQIILNQICKKKMEGQNLKGN